MAVELTLTETTVEITSSTAPGPPGAPGAPGADGQGVPTGGTTGQALVKVSNADFDTDWAAPASAPDAGDVAFTPAGNIAATDVQAALEELDSEKAATSHVHDGGDITTGTVVDARIDSAIARDSEVTAAVAAEATARDSAISTAIANLVASAPGTLDTLDELAAALGDDANFASTVTTALAGKQPLDSDLTSIAGLTPTNDDVIQRKGGVWANRSLAQLLTDLNLGASYQPLDSDLSAIAALSTTSFGRGLLALADAAALRVSAGLVIGTDVEAHDADLTTIAGLAPTNDDVLQRKSGAWSNRTLAQLIADLAALGTTFQPLDSDLTALAGLSIAADKLPYGSGSHTMALADFTSAARALLDDADASAMLTTLGVSTFIKTLLDDADAATARATLGVSGAVICDTLLGSAQASFDTNTILGGNIPGGYRAIQGIMQLRSSQAVVDAAVFALRFNNDSGANYDHRVIYGGGTTGNASQAATFADSQIAPDVNITGDSAPAGRATMVEFLIPNYDGTTFHKNCTLDLGAPNVSSGSGSWQQRAQALWRSTAAITRIAVTAGSSANWMTGSRFTLLGL